MYEVVNPFTGEKTYLPAVTVACAVEDCENYEIEFTVCEGAIMCGACSEWIVAPELPPA